MTTGGLVMGGMAWAEGLRPDGPVQDGLERDCLEQGSLRCNFLRRDGLLQDVLKQNAWGAMALGRGWQSVLRGRRTTACSEEKTEDKTHQERQGSHRQTLMSWVLRLGQWHMMS